MPYGTVVNFQWICAYLLTLPLQEEDSLLLGQSPYLRKSSMWDTNLPIFTLKKLTVMYMNSVIFQAEIVNSNKFFIIGEVLYLCETFNNKNLPAC